MQSANPKRRWFRFSLRTLFVVVTVCALPLGWSVYQLNWIRQRHQFRSEQVKKGNVSGTLTMIVDAPLSLRVFGENGQKWVGVFADEEATESEMKRAAALFPEAKISTIKRPSAFHGFQSL